MAIEVVWFEEWGTLKKRRILVTRFLKKIHPVPYSECIEWIGAIDDKGYGVFRSPLNKVKNSHRAGTSKAHRVSYWIFRGPVPKKKHIDHICRFTRCVNPYHLRLLDPYINTSLGNIDRHNDPVHDILDDINWEDIL